jgi:hypothetical protein
MPIWDGVRLIAGMLAAASTASRATVWAGSKLIAGVAAAGDVGSVA